MKNTDPVKIEQLAADALRRILAQVPAIGRLNIRNAIKGGEREIDLIADIEVFGQRHTLIAEVKSNGQPRYVRSALLQLQEYMRRRAEPATPVLIAPYLSVEAQDLCREYETAYLDLEGNARLAFGTVFISRQVASRPQVERRELRSLFKPKSAQVLRQMLRDPGHSWRVAELAKAAGVSLGLVSNVRTGLLDREWARLTNDGMLLSDPDRAAGRLERGVRTAYPTQRLGFYTTLHGASFNEAVRRLPATSLETGSTALASFSAAQWLAPYGRIGTHYFYADQQGLESLRSNLKLSPASKGENVVVMLLDDPGLFLDNTEPAPGVVCTSPVQTYLDLFKAGERGQEAAEHLRREQLKWTQ